MKDVTSLDSPETRYCYALETHQMACDLYRYIFPPWRWLKWWRAAREVKRRVRVSKTARGAI